MWCPCLLVQILDLIGSAVNKPFLKLPRLDDPSYLLSSLAYIDCGRGLLIFFIFVFSPPVQVRVSIQESFLGPLSPFIVVGLTGCNMITNHWLTLHAEGWYYLYALVALFYISTCESKARVVIPFCRFSKYLLLESSEQIYVPFSLWRLKDITTH